MNPSLQKYNQENKPPIINRPFIWLIRGYQKFISPSLGDNCRFRPTCSHYAIDCLTVHVLPWALLKAAWRIFRCNPLFAGGYDPVIHPKRS